MTALREGNRGALQKHAVRGASFTWGGQSGLTKPRQLSRSAAGFHAPAMILFLYKIGEERQSCGGFFLLLFCCCFLMREPLLWDRNSTACSRQNNTPDIIGWWAHAQHRRQQLAVVGLKKKKNQFCSRAPKATDPDYLLKPNRRQEELVSSLPFNCRSLPSAGFLFLLSPSEGQVGSRLPRRRLKVTLKASNWKSWSRDQ